MKSSSRRGPAVRNALGRASDGGKTLMPIRKFQELLDEMPAARRNKIAKRVAQALAPMPLREVRRARQVTQDELAQTLGVNQVEVSKLEHRTDVYPVRVGGVINLESSDLGTSRIIKSSSTVETFYFGQSHHVYET